MNYFLACFSCIIFSNPFTAAKKFVLNLLLRGFDGTSGDKDDYFKLPIWYDDAEFKK